MAASDIPYTDTLFQQPWWLDALAPGKWSEAVVRREGHVVARLPFVMKRRFGLDVVGMPPLTQSLGPWTRTSAAKYCNHLSEQKDLMQELIGQLPRFDLFLQGFAPEVSNWLPFRWAGFTATCCMTYRIDRTVDPARAWSDIRDKQRNDIKKAERALQVRDDVSLEQFIELNRLTFARQGKNVPYTDDDVARLDSACVARGARRILVAEDASSKLHAGLYLVSDAKTTYYIMGGSDPALRSSSAGSLLMWRAIKDALTSGRTFDFEGSMIESVEKFCRSFGARQTPYLVVSKMSRRMRLASSLRDAALALSGRN